MDSQEDDVVPSLMDSIDNEDKCEWQRVETKLTKLVNKHEGTASRIILGTILLEPTVDAGLFDCEGKSPS